MAIVGEMVSRTVMVALALPSLLLVGFVTVSVTVLCPRSSQSKEFGEML